MGDPSRATAEPAVAAPIEAGTTAEASRGAQESLTSSVGQRLTRENHDGQAPFWKRWLGKA